MAAEEDKKFDAVLGGFLVNDLRVRAGHLHCPESDVLAAYHERSLLPEEMNSWKEHILGCARCQAILAELDGTDSIPLQASEKEEALPESVSAPKAIESKDRIEDSTEIPRKSRLTAIRRGVRWQWLAPAGALAAGLLLWVAWHEKENRLAQLKAPAKVQVANAQPSPLPTAQVPKEASASSPLDQSLSISKDEAAERGIAREEDRSAQENMKRFERLGPPTKTAPAKPSASKEDGTRRDAELQSSMPASVHQNQSAPDAKAGVAGVAAETAQIQAPTANDQLQTQYSQQNAQNAQNQMNSQKTHGPNPGASGQRSKKEKSESATYASRAAAAATPAAPPPAPSAAFSDVSVSSELVAKVASVNLIVAPNKKTFWRAGHTGRIDFSNDGGASWSRQISNVLVDLTAGSAPSEKVCWIVGRAGTILLTTDAGAHWATIQSPLNEDLGGVWAADALHATIWNPGKTALFETSDGGITWKGEGVSH